MSGVARVLLAVIAGLAGYLVGAMLGVGVPMGVLWLWSKIRRPGVEFALDTVIVGAVLSVVTGCAVAAWFGTSVYRLTEPKAGRPGGFEVVRKE